ncbi:unnamed protein product [Effrenium voratum]|uniref:Uncharacterized protein n=1 Tax=Effrenium voratum TaxID=2562239 RepID=A0AA36I3L2_9DINO|nr:unnamed protein product [Effrenium voratum]
MARRSSSILLAALLVACLGCYCFVAPATQPEPPQAKLRGGEAALLGAAVAAVPQVAMAGRDPRGFLQFG